MVFVGPVNRGDTVGSGVGNEFGLVLLWGAVKRDWAVS